MIGTSKGEGKQPGLHVEIQSNQGSWRIENRYPASDTTEVVLTLGEDLQLISGGRNVLPDASTGPVYESAPLEADMFLQGLQGYMSKFQQALSVANCTLSLRTVTGVIVSILVMP